MLERGDGFSVAATRQKAGSFSNGFVAFGAPALPAGGRKSPGATVCAIVTVRSDVESDISDSHGAAIAAAGTSSIKTDKSNFIARRSYRVWEWVVVR
jgi:hypothetical protein